MGTFQQHAAIVMVHGSHDQARVSFEQVREVAWTLGDGDIWNRLLVGPVETVVNFCQVYALLPDGSKEGWSTSDDGDYLRRVFIEQMSPFGQVAEVSWGEYGERISVSTE